MIPAIRSRPIRQKVALLIAASAVIGLLFAGLAMVLYELTTFRPRAFRDARTQAEIIRVNSIAALQFNDSRAAEENLATLRNRPEILSATLLRADTTVLARYAPPGAPERPAELEEGIHLLSNRLLLVDRMETDSQLVGWLTLQYQLDPLWRRLLQYGIVAAVVLLALGVASVLLLGMLGKSVSAPLLALAGAARQISETGNYRLRVPDRSGDEIGLLTDAFNRMVAKVEEQQGALQESEARLRLALEAAEMETWMADLTGRADLEALLDRVHPEDREPIAASIRDAVAAGRGFELEFRASGGEGERWTALRGQPYRDERTGRSFLLGVAQNITERRRMAHQLIQSQRMEAIGNLAGGIAHDFNNLLTGMIGYLAFVQRRVQGDAGVRDDLAQVERAARRAAALTSQLLSYARRQMVVPTVVDLNAAVTALDPMIRRLVGEDIEVQTELDQSLGTTRVDPGQLEQVLLNLVANAREAMPDGGTLEIRTRNVTLAAAGAGDGGEVRPGEYVALEVGDSGVGMTPDVQSHIFEPFFTTKPPGVGTGLGLAMCYGIVKQADGHIEVESEPGHGSRFTVLLPREGEEDEAAKSEEPQRVPRGHETVLLVEDDLTVRELTTRMLRELGYTVLQSANAAEARTCMERHEPRIHLLLTDVVMPGGSGRDLAIELATRHPALRVLFMSGYTADVMLRQGLVQDAVAFLPKPFSQEELAEAVRSALDAPPGG